MKALVTTIGPYMLLTTRNEEVAHNRPSVIHSTDWVQNQQLLGHLRVVTSLPDEASDKEFADWLKECDGDQEMAVASYIAKFNPDSVAPPTPAPVAVVSVKPTTASGEMTGATLAPKPVTAKK